MHSQSSNSQIYTDTLTVFRKGVLHLLLGLYLSYIQNSYEPTSRNNYSYSLFKQWSLSKPPRILMFIRTANKNNRPDSAALSITYEG